MNAAARAWAAAAFVAAAVPAWGDSLRCNGSIASEGDSRISVLFKCGQPLLVDSYCAPIYAPQALQPVPEPFASAWFPCVATEEWLYDRGPGNLVAKVRFRSGVVQAIVYGKTPQ